MTAAPTTNVAGLDVGAVFNLGHSATIYSIFPLEQKIGRRFKTTRDGGYWTEYVLPAAPMDAKSPTHIIIRDALEGAYMGKKDPEGRPLMEPVPINGIAIADDFINNTRINAIHSTDGQCPGIWISAGPEHVEKEKALAYQWQERYFRAIALMADNDWFNGKKDEVGTLARLAAEWLRLDPRKHEWVKPAQRGEVKACPVCTQDIDVNAIKCLHCGEIVDFDKYEERLRQMENAKRKLAADGIKIPEEPTRLIPGKPVQAPVSK